MYNKEYQKQYKLNNKEKIAEQAKVYQLKNKEQLKIKNKIYQLKNKEKKREYNKLYGLKNKEKIKLYRLKNKEKIKEKNRLYGLNKKIEVFSHYCNGDIKCQRCGRADLRYLSVDHINGGGTKHRKEIGRHLARWIFNNNFPEGFQILCMNCQFIKRIEEKECGERGKDYIYNFNQRIKVYNHYCNNTIRCQKCNEADIRCLSIDHINGGGKKHVKGIIGSLPNWIISNNFPPDFQILCMNCQFIKRIENNECCEIAEIRK